jgi:hypothetical protein
MYYYSQASTTITDALKKLKAENINRFFQERDMALDYYQYSNTDKYIRNYFGGSLQEEIPLYTTNLCKRIIKRISLVYKDAPVRQADDNYIDYSGRKDYEMKQFERLHNLLGTIAVRIYYKNGKIYRMPILEYEPIFDMDDCINPIAIVYPLTHPVSSKSSTEEDLFAYWSDEEHFLLNGKGEKVKVNDEDINPYGVMPFVFLQPDTLVDEHWNTGAVDIAEANKQVDIAMTMLQHHIRSAGGQFVISGRVDSNNIEIGLNKVVVLEEGSMSNLNANTNITGIIEGIKFQLQNVASNHHLAFDFGVNGNKSGVALKIENLELLESREDATEQFREIEKEMYNIESRVLEAETGLSLSPDFSVDFTEVKFPDPAQEMQEWEFKFKHGIADPIDFLMQNDPDRFQSRDEAKAHIEERKGSISSENNGQNNGQKGGLLQALRQNN